MSKRLLFGAMQLAGLLASCGLVWAAQPLSKSATANAANFTNLDFELGSVGEMPPGWSMSKELVAQGFSVVLTANQPNHGQQCAEIRWPKDQTPPANLFANVSQRVEATPWRGRRVKVTAAVRVASADNGQRAQMWFRVDGPQGVSAFDNMDDRPIITSAWADYSITADVAEDAQSILLGLMTLNGATAWFDNVRIEVLAQPDTNELAVLTGRWKGTIEVGPMPLRLFFVFENDATNRLRGWLVSPDQSEAKLPFSRTLLSSNSLDFAVASVGGTYTGQLDRVSCEMKGTWKQGNMSFPLTLAFTEENWHQRRPQMPKPPFPYQAEEVTFENRKAQVKLAGTLTRPTGSGPFPAVVLISGSGPQDRDETLFGHKPFAVLADYLSRRGLIVLRYDDRGFGKSGGNFGSATSRDFADDAEAALDYLKLRREPDAKRIGFLGHSEGGIIAPMIAARRPDVGFVILLAAPGINGEELALTQAETFSRLKGFSEEGIQRCRLLNREAIRMFRSSLSSDEKKEKLNELELKMLPLMTEKDRQLCQELKARREANTETGMALIQSAWMQFLLAYDPAADLQRVKCAVLALNGQLDAQVLATQNLPAIERCLRAGGNTRFTVKEMKGLNHLFQTAQTGDLKEYGTIEETFAVPALVEILNWLKANAIVRE